MDVKEEPAASVQKESWSQEPKKLPIEIKVQVSWVRTSSSKNRGSKKRIAIQYNRIEYNTAKDKNRAQLGIKGVVQ